MHQDKLINWNPFQAAMLLYNMTGEQLSYELFKWLSGLQVIPSSLRYKSNGNFELDMRTAEGLINGSLLAKLLMQLASAAGVPLNEPLLSSIKQSSTPAAKTYNWNILSEGFLKLNVTISKETAKEISSGNFPALTRFLLDLQKRFLPKRVQKKENGEELDLVKVQAMSAASDGGTFLEAIVFLLSQQLGLTPKQAASTLGEHAKYYAHLVVKGLKGGFSEVTSLVKALKRQVDALLYLAERNPQRDTALFLDLVKPTLISRQVEVAREGALLVKNLVQCSLKYNSKNLPYQLLSVDGGFDFLYMAIKRHPDLTPNFCHFLEPLVGNALSDFLQGHLRRTINNEQEYLKVLLKIVEGFASTSTGKEQLRVSNLIALWLKQSQQSFEDKKGREQNPAHQETKLLYLELLCNLWKDFSADIGQQQAETLLMKGIQQLKKNTRTQIYSVKVPSLLRLFDFLHFLADSKNRMAAVIYKKLIFLMIQNHEQEEIRELILNNFRIMLVSYPSIPVDLLLEPLLRQLSVSEGKSYILNMFDFQFLIEAGRHPRLEVALALSFLQYLSKLYINSIIYAKLVFRVIEVLTSRFCEEQTIIEFLKRNVQSTLNLYGMLVLGKKKSTKQTIIINKQRKSLSLELIKHYSELQHRQLSYFIQNKLTSLYVSWLQEKKYSDKGLNNLLSLFGDPEQLVMQYKIIRKQGEIDPPSPIQNSPLLTPKTQSYKENDYMKEKGLGYKPIKRVSKTRMQEVQERQASKPSVKAVKDIQALKEKMKEDIVKKRAQQELQLRRASQQNNLNSLQLLQRNLSLGYAKLSPLQQSQLFQFDSVKPKQLKWTSRFHELSQLQDQDEKSAQVILKQYTKEIKSLFLKYALMSATTDNRKDESNAVMSFTQVMKMLKEKGIDIGKLVASDLIATINYSKRRERNVLGGIQESQFPQFLLKTTDYLIQQEVNALELPFGLRLQRLIISLLQGQAFYQNRFRNKQLQQIARLKQAANSDSGETIEIPEGFRKVKQSCVYTDYKLNENDWGVPTRLQIGYEIADWLLNKSIGIHIVTPVVRIGQRFNIIQVPKPIKPKLPKQETEPKSLKIDPDSVGPQTLQVNLSKDKAAKPAAKGNLRSTSHRVLGKTKTDPLEGSQEDRERVQKQLKYAQKLRQNLQRLKQQKAAKLEADRVKEEQERKQKEKREQQRKKYLDGNKQKLKQQKIKQQEDKKLKQQKQKQQKQSLKHETRKKQQQLFEKHKEAIKVKAQKLQERRQELQLSREKKAQVLQKLAKEVTNEKPQGTERLRVLQVHNSLQKGELRQIVAQYDRQLTDLFQSYWLWQKKRIDLNSLALLFRDFQLAPDPFPPKLLAETYKSLAKGQTLDYQGFKQCLMRCAYRSDKLLKQYPSPQGEEGLNAQLARAFLKKLRMDEPNYKEIIKQSKNHEKK